MRCVEQCSHGRASGLEGQRLGSLQPAGALLGGFAQILSPLATPISAVVSLMRFSREVRRAARAGALHHPARAGLGPADACWGSAGVLWVLGFKRSPAGRRAAGAVEHPAFHVPVPAMSQGFGWCGGWHGNGAWRGTQSTPAPDLGCAVERFSLIVLCLGTGGADHVMVSHCACSTLHKNTCRAVNTLF